MANYLVRSGTLLEDFEAIGNWTQDVGAAAADATIKNTGTQSIKLTAAVGDVGRMTKTISSNLAADGSMVLWVYLTTKTGINNIQVILSSSASFTTYFSISKSVGVLHEGWNAITIARTDWTTNGAESWANTMVRLRLAVYATEGATPSVYFDSLYVGRYSRPKCVFTFDDGVATAITQGVAYMQNYRMKGTLYVNKDYIDSGGSFATTAQIQSAYDKGWDIGNHTTTHTHLADLTTEAEIESEIQQTEDVLAANGWTRNNCHKHLCYPYGSYDAMVLDVADRLGCITATCTLEKLQASFDDNNLLFTRHNLGNNISLATAKGYVDRAIAQGSTIIFQLHRIVDTATTATEWPTADFQALVDYIAARSNLIDVAPMTEWYRGLTSPRKVI